MGKGAPLCLNGAFILSHLGPYGDDGTGRLSRGPFSLPLKGHSEGQWKHIFWLRKRVFPSILSPNAARVRVRAAVNLDPHRAVTVTVVHEWTTYSTLNSVYLRVIFFGCPYTCVMYGIRQCNQVFFWRRD